MVPHYCWAGSFSHLQISSNDGIRVKVAVKREGHDGVIVEISNQKRDDVLSNRKKMYGKASLSRLKQFLLSFARNGKISTNQ